MLEAKNYSKTARFSVSLKPPQRLRKMDLRALVASQRLGAKNYSGTARFSLSGLAKSCLGPKITPKQRVSLCVASLNKLFRRSEEAASSFEGPREAPWGVHQASGKMARFPFRFKSC